MVKPNEKTNPVPENVQVMLDCPVPLVLGDINQLPIVFANLIRDARVAMPQGGFLRISGSGRSSVKFLRMLWPYARNVLKSRFFAPVPKSGANQRFDSRSGPGRA
jgi:hypothetical protein